MLRVIGLLLLCTLVVPPALVAQTIPCEALSYFNPQGNERVFTQPLPTAWFGIRMSPQYDATVDTAFFAFGITKVNSITLFDSIHVRILAPTTPLVTVLDQAKVAIPPNFSGQIPDSYWMVEMNFDSQVATLSPPRDFWLSWRILGSSANTARIRVKTPAINRDRSVVIAPAGTTTPFYTYAAPQLGTDTADLWAETRVCYPNGVPVELNAFTVVWDARGAVLEWNTESETDNFGFEIQRSASISDDDKLTIWQTVAFVNGKGTTQTPNSYRWIDATAAQVARAGDGMVKYRLRQIDYDGSASLSPIRVLRIPSGDASLALDQSYPNPVHRGVRGAIGFSTRDAALLRVELFDATGRLLRVLAEGAYAAGYHTVELDTETLPAGVYHYRLTSGTASFARSLTILPR